MASDLLSTPPPLAPPLTQGAMVSWLRLIRSHRVGVSTFFRLLSEHGSADAALDVLPDIATAAGVQKYSPCSVQDAERELQAGQRLGARLICFGSAEYPVQLSMIADPPPLLWALGRIDLLNTRSIAIVGARNASSLGTRMARFLAKDLGELGFATVSGLARGIDAAVHNASLPTGTIAVQAGGVDVVYPNENEALQDQIGQTGLRISEQPIGLQPQARHFPRRNRIISGLGQAVIVVEAAAKSGSLITARDALDQGRDVMAVPGHPLDARSAGNNLLIRDGAILVRNARDVMESLTPIAPVENPKSKSQTADTPVHEHGPAHAEILNLLGPTPIAEDQLIRDLAKPAHLVAPTLLNLEMRGKISRQPGGLLCKVP